MNPTCRDFDRMADPRSAEGSEEREIWRRHVEGCARCREQTAAHRMLRVAFQSQPALLLSEDFDGALRRRLSERRSRRSLGPSARAVFAAYATAAAGFSIWILGELTWPSQIAPNLAAMLALLVALGSPLLLLPRSSPFAPPGLD